MDRLKVLFVTSWYPTREQPIGGIFVREHAKAVQLYDDVVVLHLAGYKRGLRRLWELEEEMDPVLTEDIPTYRIWHRFVSIGKASFLLRVWATLNVVRELIRRGFSPDIIHANVYGSAATVLPAAKLYRVPLIVTEHSSTFLMRQLSLMQLLLAKAAFELADCVCPVSGALERAIKGYCIRCKTEVIPNVVDTDAFRPKTCHPAGNPKQLVYVGILAQERKGLHILLQAIAKLCTIRSDFRLHVVGDGPRRLEYQRMVSSLNIESCVVFEGRLPRNKLAELLINSHVFVLPSLSENFSVATAEALATGTPVVATRCGGPEEFVTAEVGELVPPGDPDALARGINRVLDHLGEFDPQKIAQHAASRFSPHVVGRKLDQVYLSALDAGDVDESELHSV